MTRTIGKIATAALAALLLLGVAAGPAVAQEDQSIATVATEDGRFSTLVTALTAAGLADTFASCDDGAEYTVLAPTDDAFAAALAALELDPAALLADTELLTTVLTYHVLEGAIGSETVLTLDGASAPTLQGEEVSVSVTDGTISILSGAPAPATVVVADVAACNGVIHAIDNVLIPPTVAEALGLSAAAEGEGEGEGEELAQTGVDSDQLVVVGLAVLGAGAMVLGTSRRRQLRS